jgi:serine/threonine protein kinase
MPSDGRFGSYALILPYADGGSLHGLLRLSEPPGWLREATSSASTCDIVYSQTFGLLDALTLIHSKLKSSAFIIHRDIKSSNILIQNGTFKLADFGLARIKAVDETSKTDWYAGTPMYAPPERTVGGEAGFGRARDAWAMGCVLLEILILLCHGFSRTPEVESFEQERLKSSGEQETRAFSLTMECVSNRLDRLDAMIENTEHLGDRGKLKTMLTAVRGMLCLNPTERMTSLLARDKLQEQHPNHQLRLPSPGEEGFIETYGTRSFAQEPTSRAFMTYFKVFMILVITLIIIYSFLTNHSQTAAQLSMQFS